MFSGIISTAGTLKAIASKGRGLFFDIHAPTLAHAAHLGASISVDGVCLTVCAKHDEVVVFEIMPETLAKTTLGEKKAGIILNIEPSLKVGDELGGHFVYGHVDGIGKIIDRQKEGDTALLTIRPPQELMKYMAAQGSVAVDGVSLTIARRTDETFTVSLVEFTERETTLGSMAVGDRVNIECDMLAKYAENLKL